MALPLGFSTIVSVIYQQLDILMLSRLDTSYAVGIYSAGLRLTNFAALLPIAISGSLFSLFSSYYASDHARLRLLYRRSLDYMVMLALPMAGFVTLLSDKLVAFIFKPEFGPSAPVLALNIWAVALLFTGIISGNLLIAANRQRTNLLLLLLALAVDAGLDLLLIPTFSYLGATLANLVSVIVLVGATLVISGRLICFRYSWRVPGRVSLIVGMLSPLVFVTRDISFFITLPLLAILFFGLLLATRIIPLAELRQLFWRGRL
jgi:O-antigen/teichoic acid export membrane protein